MEANRYNLEFFGVRELDHYHSTVPEQIIDALNSFCRHTWVPEDISRAFRLGERWQTGEPRPVVVQFHRWIDKMEILGDKRMRGLMRKEDIRVTSDLTTRRRSMVDFYKQPSTGTEHYKWWTGSRASTGTSTRTTTAHIDATDLALKRYHSTVHKAPMTGSRAEQKTKRQTTTGQQRNAKRRKKTARRTPR